MLNQVNLIGRLGQDPELKSTQTGKKVCNISIATTEKYKTQDGKVNEKTQWHRVILWNKQAEIAFQYLHKGALVYVCGKIQTREFEDRQSNTRLVTEVVAKTIQFLHTNQRNDNHSPKNEKTKAPQPPKVNDDEEIPF